MSLKLNRGWTVPLKMSAGEEDESLQRLVDLPGRRYILVGGKGGVGKTSTSSAIAVKLADEGLKTLIISTDPAHSLGDALMTDLSSGRVTPIAEQGGLLYALEVDLVQAVAEFKKVIQGLKGDGEGDSPAGARRSRAGCDGGVWKAERCRVGLEDGQVMQASMLMTGSESCRRACPRPCER